MLRRSIVLAGALLWAGAAAAADQPQYGPEPAWVKPIPIPAAGAGADGAAMQVLLQDQQTSFVGDSESYYSETAYKILSPQGLAAVGNVVEAWNPDTDILTIHHIRILRDGKVIDALAGGQKMLVLRRETGLELAELDGTMTATFQPEGLQVGDILDIAFTLTRSDPIAQGYSEGDAALARPGVVGRAYFRATWPARKPVRWLATDGLGAPTVTTGGDGTELIYDLSKVEAPKAPNGAPPRYANLATLQLSQFSSWAEVSALMAPLYEKAQTLAPNSPLSAEISKIKASTSDPAARASAALRLVEDDTRYFALVMGAGGYAPAAADVTWARKFGDCKGKTVLLLALLHGLGIEAQPALVNTTSGDGLDERLPTMDAFDHVIVRATIGGKVYWLDGTRLGDEGIDRLQPPAFHWALPVQAQGAALVKIDQPPLDAPNAEYRLSVDASAGIDQPAAVQGQILLRQDSALAMRLGLDSAGREEAQRSLMDLWRKTTPWIEPKTASYAYDAATGALTISMTGTGAMDWSRATGYRGFQIDGSAIGYSASFARDPGPHEDAPYQVPYPFFVLRTDTVILPKSGQRFDLANAADVNQTVAGVKYLRHAVLKDGVVTVTISMQSIEPEFPASEAAAAAKALYELSIHDVVIREGVASSDSAASVNLVAEGLENTLDDAKRKSMAQDVDGAFNDLKEVVSSPGFVQLSEPDQHVALSLYGWAALTKKDLAVARPALAQASNMAEATMSDWMGRYDVAVMSHDYGDAARCIAKISRSWPASLSRLPAAGVRLVIAGTKGDGRFETLSALYDANWSRSEESGDWLALSADLLDRGQPDRAAEVAKQVTSASVLMDMRADRRFDAIVKGDPARFDAAAALDRELKTARDEVMSKPDKLSAVNHLANELLSKNQPAEALTLLDGALARIRAAEADKPPFTDENEVLNWTLNARANALFVLGRSDEAIKEMLRAAARPEGGSVNISQTINLADDYDNLGRPQDALDELQDLGSASPYGAMQAEEAKACAFAQLGDQAGLAASLQRLRARADIGGDALGNALLCAKDDDGLAKFIIARLEDPDTRDDELGLLQDTQVFPNLTEVELAKRDRWIAVRNRPDVQAEIAKVGRIESYPLYRRVD